MLRPIRTLISPTLMLGFCLAAAAQAGTPGDLPVNEKYLTPVRQTGQQLVWDLERLQDRIIAELKGEKKRALYRQTDSALNDALSFLATLKPGGVRKDVYARFDQLDDKLHHVFDAVRKLDPTSATLLRAVDHVFAADAQLHYALSAGDMDKDRLPKVIARQAQALAVATKELEKAATYALSDSPGHEVILSDMRTLHALAEQLQKNTQGKSDPKELNTLFAPINSAWEKVTTQLKRLPPRENTYLLRTAGRVDMVHEHLFRLLGMKGERPRLTIPT